MRWRVLQTYLHLLPQAAPRELGDSVQPRHFLPVQSGKAQGPDVTLPHRDICIDITRYRQLGEKHQLTLCQVMRYPRRWKASGAG